MILTTIDGVIVVKFRFDGEYGTVSVGGRIVWRSVKCHIDELDKGAPLAIVARDVINRHWGRTA